MDNPHHRRAHRGRRALGLNEPGGVDGLGGAEPAGGPSVDDIFRACAYVAAALDGRTAGDAALITALLHGQATLDEIARRDPRGVDAESDVRAAFEAIHMALDLAELGTAVSGSWLQEAYATIERSEAQGRSAPEILAGVALKLGHEDFAALGPMEQATLAHELLDDPALSEAGVHRLAGVVASVYTLRECRLPSFVPLGSRDEYREALVEAHGGDGSKLTTLVTGGVDQLRALIAEPPVAIEPVAAVGTPLPAAPVPQEPALAPAPDEPASAPAPEVEQEPDDVGDTLPADLDVSAYVGQYTFPDIHRRRIPGYIYLGVATGCFALWVSRRGHDPVMVNTGLVVAAFGFLLVGWYHLATAWPLDVKDTDALIAASREVGFPVGHASAQLGWRGLRSRPTWRILVYSSEDPPAQRGLVLVDGTDGTVLSHFTETNPEDWSAYQ